jgi:hypothetical protein
MNLSVQHVERISMNYALLVRQTILPGVLYAIRWLYVNSHVLLSKNQPRQNVMLRYHPSALPPTEVDARVVSHLVLDLNIIRASTSS